MSATDIAAPPTVAELVAVSAGREGTMLRTLRDAAAQIEENIRQRIAHDASALGVAPDALARLLDGGVGAPVAEPAKRQRAAKTLPPAPSGDALLEALLDVIEKKERITSKGLAKSFSGLTIVLVDKVLHAERGRGADARVKLEPNGRTWVRAVTS